MRSRAPDWAKRQDDLCTSGGTSQSAPLASKRQQEPLWQSDELLRDPLRRHEVVEIDDDRSKKDCAAYDQGDPLKERHQ